MPRLCILALFGLALACAPAEPQERTRGDSGASYMRYVSEASEFRPVRPVAARRWDTWIYMPWRYRWTIGTGEAGGRFCRDLGINGGMTDHGEGPLDWLARWHLRFYNDHTAGKGDLYLEPRGLDARLGDPQAIRPRPLDRALSERLKATVTERGRRIR